jgi:hypothetical protein
LLSDFAIEELEGVNPCRGFFTGMWVVRVESGLEGGYYKKIWKDDRRLFREELTWWGGLLWCVRSNGHECE